MKAGAVEFLTKPFRDQAMLDAVQLGHEQDRRRREVEDSSSKLKSNFATLTPREKEIIELVVKNLMNKQIAGELGISEITVKVHRGIRNSVFGPRGSPSIGVSSRGRLCQLTIAN
jgi:FixJ family two-component response regulator